MKTPVIRFQEQLGVRYPATWLDVTGTEAEALCDEISGAVYAVQRAPATALDAGTGATVALIALTLEPGQELRLVPCAAPAPSAGPIAVELQPDRTTVIRNGQRTVRLPASGLVEPPFPGPWAGLRLGDGDWFGDSALVDAGRLGRVTVTVESVGPAFVQWRVAYRWGADSGLDVVCRWAAGSDTVLVAERGLDDTAAAVEWAPFGAAPAKAFMRGGGESKGPMQPLTAAHYAPAARGQGRRLLQRLSHVSSFNQWTLSWVGFSAGDDRFAGVFSALGGRWRRRGFVRPEVWEDDARGALLRFPVRAGERFYGLVFCGREESALDSREARCVLNRRKTTLSDLRLDKVRTWTLDGPLEPRAPQLVRAEDLEGFRARVASDPDLVRALESVLALENPPASHELAAALYANQPARLARGVEPLLDFANKEMEEIPDGGYERLIIFDGRAAKLHVYHFDLLWALGILGEPAYRAVRRCFLALAYMYADPDYCVYADYWPHTEPGEGIADALKDEMGDCPVPPNFASEFFSTTGVMAELFPSHPASEEWRRWAITMTDRFWDTFFSEDGTYAESINYHTHGFNEMLCHFYPLYIHGVRDYFAEPKVRGSYEHFLALVMPPLADGLPDKPDAWGRLLYADFHPKGRCVQAADGNSGGEALEQNLKGEFALGAAVYKQSDPELARRLMGAWRRGGKLLLDGEHPLLSMLTVDPSIPSAPPDESSVYRRWAGVISRARQRDGAPVWSLFRAGRATHHMCFDQGNVHLAAWDSVLLCDPGYHVHDTDGASMHAAATWLHNTVVYSDRKEFSHGYTGVERAPDPALVSLHDAFDWCVHRIVNTNVRDLGRLFYTAQVPVPRTVHVRHYLFVKPDYFVIWDVFEEAHGPTLFFLHPRTPVVAEDRGFFRTGAPGTPHLRVQFLQPAEPLVAENRRVGPMWSFAVTNGAGKPYLAVLMPQKEERGIVASLAADGRTLTVRGQGVADTVVLPAPGRTDQLPVVIRA
jgi:hypothetical protein